MPFVKVEPLGCEERFGLVKVQFDFFLTEEDCRYSELLINMPIFPQSGYPGEMGLYGAIDNEEYERWRDALPHQIVLTPFHSHLLHFEPNVTQEEVEEAIKYHIPHFYYAWCQEQDKIPCGMRKGWETSTRGAPKRYNQLLTPSEYKERQQDCEAFLNKIKKSNLIVASNKISNELFPSTAIDIGYAAAVYDNHTSTGYTWVDGNNTANATGVIDTWETRVYDNITTLKVATMDATGGNDFQRRDYESWSSVTTGAKRTLTGASTTVESGDHSGFYHNTGSVYINTAGVGVGYCSGDQIATSGEDTYTILGDRAAALYGTGDTPPVITNASGATNITSSAARLNGTLTDTSGACTVTVYWGKSDGGTTPGNWTNSQSLGVQAAGAVYYDISELDSGTTYYYRFYATSYAGEDWANSSEDFNTLSPPPDPPTNVSATDGSYTDKVVITWTKSDGATGYKVYEGENLLDTLGDVASYDDTAAPAPVITPGAASASDGLYTFVRLSLSGHSVANGSSRTYSVKAVNAGGDSDASDTDTGYRGHGTLTYQWQRSSADSDADYSNIDGATSTPYDDSGAPEDGSGRYYKCILSATGAANQNSSSDRGFILIELTSSDSMSLSDTSAILATLLSNDSFLISEILPAVIASISSQDKFSILEKSFGISIKTFDSGAISENAVIVAIYSANDSVKVFDVSSQNAEVFSYDIVHLIDLSSLFNEFFSSENITLIDSSVETTADLISIENLLLGEYAYSERAIISFDDFSILDNTFLNEKKLKDAINLLEKTIQLQNTAVVSDKVNLNDSSFLVNATLLSNDQLNFNELEMLVLKEMFSNDTASFTDISDLFGIILSDESININDSSVEIALKCFDSCQLRDTLVDVVTYYVMSGYTQLKFTRK